MDSNQYLVGEGPFSLTSEVSQEDWHLFCPNFFFSSKPCWYRPSATAFFSTEELQSFLRVEMSERKKMNWKWKEPLFSDFQDIFFAIKEQIESKEIQKLVPVLFETSHYQLDKVDWFWLLSLFTAPSDGFAYAWWSEGQAIVGRTPEYLFRKEDKSLQTMALAGTARSETHDLLQDEKERREHKWVSDDIENISQSFGDCVVSNIYVDSFAELKHLRTDFRIHLKKQASFLDLCQAFHPTPALGGVPRKKAVRLLKDFDCKYTSRHRFGAPFGVSKGRKAFCVVAIRNIQVIEKNIYLGAGCGLVKESRLEDEWTELKLKHQYVKKILS